MKHSLSPAALCLIAVIFLALNVPGINAQQNPSDMLSGLRPNHPRLFLTPERLQAIQLQAKTDPIFAELIELIKKDAEAMLTKPVVKYEIPDGKRLLAQSRYAIQRIWMLSLAYRLSDDRRFLDAAVNEMLTAAAFKDWNPPHFLDTAEMTAALAVGYDWLYDDIRPEDRETIRKAMIRLGMEPGLEVLKQNTWWARTDNNWNQVCNGGLILGALALADEEPALAREMIDRCLKSIPHGLKAYRPDGAYPEGPGYWVYGTSYTVITILALDSALGHDFDIHKSEALDRTAAYRLQMEGPAHQFYNYADGGSGVTPNFATLGLAHIYRQPNIAKRHLAAMVDYLGLGSKKTRSLAERFSPLEVIYYPESKELIATSETFEPLPLDSFFRGRQDLVIMRGNWDDPDTAFLGIKGGDNQTNHGHLDIGSFVLDANGVRWAIDLGPDNYNMPGYFNKGGPRWKYYRMINQSHNTLVIGDKLQNLKAVSRVTDFKSTPNETHAMIDMSEAYKDQAESVVRKASLLDRQKVVIQDTITSPTDDVRWGMVTQADITLDGPRATLKQGNRQMNVEILSPANAQFEIVSTRPKTEQENQNRDTQMLAFTVKPDGKEPVTLEVVFTPVK